LRLLGCYGHLKNDATDRNENCQSFTLTVFDKQHLNKNNINSQILKMKTTLIKTFRWTVRILSATLIVFFLFMFVGETFFQGGSFNPKSMSTDAILKVSLFVLSLIGLVLTWKWELMGAIIALAAYVGLLIIIDTEPIKFYFLLIYPIIPILFIVLWAIRRNVVEKNEEIQNI
jgi:hypothetical protein